MTELLDDAESFGNDQADARRDDGGMLVTYGAQEAVTDNADGAFEIADLCVFARHYRTNPRP